VDCVLVLVPEVVRRAYMSDAHRWMLFFPSVL